MFRKYTLENYQYIIDIHLKDVLTGLFDRVGLRTNKTKTVSMAFQS